MKSQFKKNRIITLLITHDCNLRCRYCYVREYKACSMSLETAQRVISAAFEEAKGSYDHLEFVFLGGEPLMFYERIMEIAEWVWEQEWEIPYLLSAVTNGTLLDEYSKEWFKKNRERIILCLSYDGIGDAQNINRSQSVSRIDVDFFLHNWPEQGLKMTISEESVPYLAESIINLQEKGVRVNSSFAGGVPPWESQSLDILKKQLEVLADYYNDHREWEPNNLLSINLLPVLEDREFIRAGCGLGESRITYDYDGQRYSCHLLSPLVLREEEVKKYEKMDTCCGEVTFHSCKECVLDTICPTCIGNSIRLFGKPDYREKNSCNIFKIQVMSACRYQLKRSLSNSQIDSSEKYRIKAIKYIMEKI